MRYLHTIFTPTLVSWDTLLNHHSSISIGGREIFSLRFADNIDLINGSNDELQKLAYQNIIVYQHMRVILVWKLALKIIKPW